MKDKFGIILIHGAGLGKFIWQEIAPNLNYSSLMIEFPNRNTKNNKNSKLRFEDYVAKAISDAKNFGKEKVIIVTHSIGGLIGLRIAESLNDKIIGFVGIGSAIPENGKSFISCLPFPQKLIIPILMKIAGTMPPKSAIENGLCNDLNPAQTKTVVQNFTAESKYLYTDNSKSRIPKTNKLYVALKNDKEFPMTVQKRMAKNLNCQNITILESGHLPMIGTPEKISEILNEFIETCINKN